MDSMNTSKTEDDSKLFGGVAVITGAGRGIGAAMARRAAQLGMIVVVVDIAATEAEKIAKEIHDSGGRADAYAVDVTNPAAVEQLAENVHAKYSDGVRLLVNNAGIEAVGILWEMPPEQWEKVLSVNVLGVVNGLRAFVPRMLASGAECWISNVVSQVALCHLPTQGAYCASKHALQSLTECLYLELEMVQSKIHVSSVIPGMVRTSVFEDPAEAVEKGGKDQPTRYRLAMKDIMRQHGQDVDESAKNIISQIAANKFWIPTHPADAEKVMKYRASFIGEHRSPEQTNEAQLLINLWNSAKDN